MINVWIVGMIAAVCLMIAIVVRIYLAFIKISDSEVQIEGMVGIGQTTGNKEIQADKVQVVESNAGTIAVLADGIGSHNTGRVCAQLALDTILDRYEPYEVLYNPNYFFKTAFFEANKKIQITIGDRRGGTSLGAVFLNETHLYYAVAGDVKIALFRNGELIPLSKGQTLNVLAIDAWKEGKITRQDVLWSLEEHRIWNYVGMDGFKKIEIATLPIQLKHNDIVFLASKGVLEELSWNEIEDILVKPLPVQEMVDEIIWATNTKTNEEKENGTVVLLKINRNKNEDGWL